VRGDIALRGWARVRAADLNFPLEEDAITAFSPALALDPRGSGKSHARDVITYTHGALAARINEAESIAHVDGTDDYSRFTLSSICDPLGCDLATRVATTMLAIEPPQYITGRISADYFRYGHGVDVSAHRDGFGTLVAIWVLSRIGDGGVSFLRTDLHDGHSDVMHTALSAGDLLIFRDEMFYHGVTPLLDGGSRDAMIFITLRDAK
jgi:hypothetical protein